MRPVSLRARLLGGVIALAAVGLIVLASITYVQQRDFLLERAEDQARSSIPAVTRAMDEQSGVQREGSRQGPRPGGGGPGGPPQTAPVEGVYGERRDASGAKVDAVVLTFGDETPAVPDLPDDMPVGEPVTVSSDAGDYMAYASPSPGGGITIAAIPLSGVDEQLDELVLVEAAVIGVVLLLMGGLGFWVVRLGLRPLDRIGETAGRIADGDLSQRVTPADSRTEVGRLGLSLNAMLHQIEEAFAERQASEDRLRRFLADASHELRTPLASVRGYAELYRMGAARDGEEAERAMSRIEQEAARMGVLVEDLLLLARLDEVRDAVREPVDLASLASDAAEDARATAPDRSIALDAAVEDALVLGDGDQLRQVLANLVRNALVHTPAGTPVELRVVRAGSQVELAIRDHGPGLPVDDGAELFERFWRADPSRGRGPAGAGLGLAIVYGIVAAHGGSVRAENAPGGGAVFTVELPAMVVERA